MIIDHQNNFLHMLVYFVLLHGDYYKQTDLNITEFLTKILLFPEDCAS